MKAYVSFKQGVYLLMVLCSLFWCCSKGDEGIDDPDEIEDPNNPENPDKPMDTYLEVQPSDIIFEAEGGVKKFLIDCYDFNSNSSNSDVRWTVKNESDWCNTDVSFGYGYGYITLTAEEYSELDDRNTNLVIEAGNKVRYVTVTQKHSNSIILSKDKFEVPFEGGQITIETKNKVDKAIIPQKYQAWIKQVSEVEEGNIKKFTFEISRLKDWWIYYTAEGYITFRSGSLRDTVYVYNTEYDNFILSDKHTYNFGYSGGDIKVGLSTKYVYDIEILDGGSSWISRINTKAARYDYAYFRIAPNEENAGRHARILIKDKYSDLSDTIYINQGYGKTLVLETEQDLEDFCKTGSTVFGGYMIVQGKEITSLQKLGNLLTRIDGSLTINAESCTTLEGLGAIKTITEDLIVKKSKITSFKGLEKLESVGGDILLVDSTYRPVFSSCEGLNSLKTVGGNFEVYFLRSHDDKISSSGLENLETIGGEFYLNTNSYKGLKKLREIGGDFSVGQAGCTGLESLEIIGGELRNRNGYSLCGLENLREVKGVIYAENASFEPLGNLDTIGGDFQTKACSFVGMKSLKSVGGNFVATEPSSSFEGLKSLTTIGGDFEVTKSISFEGLENLKTVEGDFSVRDVSLLTSFKGLEGLVSVGGALYIIHSLQESAWHAISLEGLNNLETVEGSFYISGGINGLSSFKGLNALKRIGGHFMITSEKGPSMAGLESFAGLENLETIGGDFRIGFESCSPFLASLTSFSGLSGLKHIGGSFKISVYSSDPVLNALESFAGLENLETIGCDFIFDIRCREDSDPVLNSLTSFSGLSGLKSIGGNFELAVRNSLNALESFAGLDNLELIDGDFIIDSEDLKVVDFYFTINIPSRHSLSSLSSFKGLNKLKKIGGNFNMKTASPLPSLTSFDGLNSLESVGGDFRLEASSNFLLPKFSSLKGLESLERIGANELSLKNCNSLTNIDALGKLQRLDRISIMNCSMLYDFCVLKNVVQNMRGTYYIHGNGYNPAKYQLLEGECSQSYEY